MEKKVSATAKPTQATPLWGGGFSESMHPALAQISHSMLQDMPLADADLRASVVYARALARCGVLSTVEAEELATALEAMRSDLAAGRWLPADAEDVHTAIEAEVTRRVGELGGRLHTGRSRNDQVATAFRLAVGERAAVVMQAIKEVQQALVARAADELDTLLPAYTHMQRAQPVRLAHWILSHFWPLQRDLERLAAARRRALSLPLGSGAVTGHPFGIDRAWMAAQLGFVAVSDNSLDAVGDRDFAVEFAFCCALVATHLSRLAEELVLWSSSEFGFVGWPDSLATGSSLMPNKKNPDLAELVRGRSAMAVADVVALLVLLKGLPSSYQRDLQEDKPPVWRTAQAVEASLAAMAAAVAAIAFNRERMRAALSDDLLATEAADLLVARGVAFRQAHSIVAKLAALSRQHGVGLKEVVRLKGAAVAAPLRGEEIEQLTAEAAVERRTAWGGTARQAVVEQLERARAALAQAL